ncbi:hypothetical protein Hanom_Chr17g01561651 [Helianthus anomalus]
MIFSYLSRFVLGFETLFGDDGGLLPGMTALFAAAAALSSILLVPAMMKCHFETFHFVTSLMVL